MSEIHRPERKQAVTIRFTETEGTQDPRRVLDAGRCIVVVYADGVSNGPLNYTTAIDPGKSASECIAILALHGATGVAMTYDNGLPGGLHFRIPTAFGELTYSLPTNTAGTQLVLERAYRAGRIPKSKATVEQAQRTSWRVVKMWLEAQLALIEAGLVDLPQVMLPFMIDEAGRTVYQRFIEREQLALEAGAS